MQQSGFHHANILVQELTNKFEEHLAIRDSQLLSIKQSILSLAATSSSSNSDETPPAYAANSISSNIVQLEILKLLKELRADIKSSNHQPKPDLKPSLNLRRGPNLKTPDYVTKKRWRVHHYCWTHGRCGHASDKCNSKAEGYKDEATFNNKIRGSKAHCR